MAIPHPDKAQDTVPGQIYTGGCACGAVRFEAIAPPLRMGLCHCMVCRRHHASAFNPFVVFKAKDVLIAGSLRAWRSSNHATRLSCEVCSSPICQQEDEGEEIELHLGSFDEASLFAPQYENWVGHRESWLPYLRVPQKETDTGYERRQAAIAPEVAERLGAVFQSARR